MIGKIKHNIPTHTTRRMSIDTLASSKATKRKVTKVKGNFLIILTLKLLWDHLNLDEKIVDKSY